MDHLVKQIESWDPVQSGDDHAESDLVKKFLDLYELTFYYQVEEAFLSFRGLEAFASKITNDMLCEWHSHIGDNISDECLPEMVVQFLRIPPRRIYSHPDRGKSSDRSGEDVSSEEVEREAGNVASKVTRKMQQQARDARLQPLIKVGVRGIFPRARRDFVLKDATILYCTLRKSVSIL